MADQAKIANIRAMAKQAAEKSGRRHLKSVSSNLPGKKRAADSMPEPAVDARQSTADADIGASLDPSHIHTGHDQALNTNQAFQAGSQTHQPPQNRPQGQPQSPQQSSPQSQAAHRHAPAQDESTSMVPVDIRTQSHSRGRDLQAINEAVNLAELERHELSQMQESKLFSDRQLEQLGIVHPRSKNRAVVDSVRQLRTKLFSLRKTGNFSVLVSSVVPGGGSSFIALNLAATIAFDQTKTSLLLDANLQNPFLHKMLKLIGRKNPKGLVDFLETPSMGVESIVHPSGIPRLRIVPAGSPQRYSEEHLSSQLCNKLMIDIQQRYSNRYIVVDGPSISGSADASVLADLCDFLVLVVPYGAVSPGYLDSLIDEIDETKLAGIVLNDQPE